LLSCNLYQIEKICLLFANRYQNFVKYLIVILQFVSNLENLFVFCKSVSKFDEIFYRYLAICLKSRKSVCFLQIGIEISQNILSLSCNLYQILKICLFLQIGIKFFSIVSNRFFVKSIKWNNFVWFCYFVSKIFSLVSNRFFVKSIKWNNFVWFCYFVSKIFSLVLSCFIVSCIKWTYFVRFSKIVFY